MKYIITIIFILLLTTSQIFAREPNELKFNPIQQEWSYERRNSELKYNPFEDKFQNAPRDSELRFNPMERRWEYEK
jgi:hypothetical protein